MQRRSLWDSSGCRWREDFEGNLEEGLEILQEFLKIDKETLKSLNKRMKENDGELEKVNQLLGKVHKEAEAGKRRVLLTEEREELLPQLERVREEAEKAVKEPGQIQRLMLSIQRERENLERYMNLEKLSGETEDAARQIERLEKDSIVLQNRQKEMKSILEEKQTEYQVTDCVEKERAETDFQKEKTDNLFAGVYKNCGNLEFLQEKIKELEIQSGEAEKSLRQMKKELTELEEKLAVMD